MTDSASFRRCIVSHLRGTDVVPYGTVRLSSDADVVANPQFWEALSDALLTSKRIHG